MLAGSRWRRAVHCVVSASNFGGGPSFRGVGVPAEDRPAPTVLASIFGGRNTTTAGVETSGSSVLQAEAKTEVEAEARTKDEAKLSSRPRLKLRLKPKETGLRRRS